MIWHIIKKDLALLWPWVVGLAVLHAVIELAGYHADGSGEDWEVLLPLNVLIVIVWAFVVALVAHQDPLPGTRQDWLTRPIKRGDLLLAKLLFLVALVHGPRFLANAAGVLAAGFSLPEALGAAATNGFTIFGSVTLPALAIAAVTRTMTELLIGGIIVGFIMQAAMVLFTALNGNCGPTCETSIEWISIVAQPALIAAGALAVLGLQYFRRDAIRTARGVVAVTALSVVALWHMPWDVGFAIQQLATGVTEPRDRITIEMDGSPPSQFVPPNASERTLLSAARASLAFSEIGKADIKLRRWTNPFNTVVRVPLRVSGLRPGEVIWTDRVVFRLVNPDGRVFRGSGDELEIRANGSGAQSAQQTFTVPTSLFDAARDTDLRLELDYWLTSLEPNATLTLPTAGGEGELSGAKCGTGLRSNSQAVRFACISIDRPPSCYTAALESRSTGTRDPDVLICDPDYGPYNTRITVFRPFAIALPLAPSAAAGSSVVQVSAYAPRAHSVSRLVVPRLRLSEWVVTEP